MHTKNGQIHRGYMREKGMIKRHTRPQMQTSQKVEQVKTYFSAVETSTTHSIKPWTTQKNADWDWASLGWARQRYQYCKRNSWKKTSKPKIGKGTKPSLASLCNTPVRKPGKALSRMASRQNRVRDEASHSRKQQTARPHRWFSLQRPVRVGLHCQVRCHHHPWRQCSLHGLNRQLDNGGGSI